MLKNKVYILCSTIMIFFIPTYIVKAGDKGMITIVVENKALQPRIVQVRDLAAYSKPAWKCEEAKMTLEQCRRVETTANKNNLKTTYNLSESDCAKAEIILQTMKCLYPDLILDQKLDGSEKIEIRIHTDYMGFGEIAVRSVDNTLYWTVKHNLKDGDIVGHQ